MRITLPRSQVFAAAAAAVAASLSTSSQAAVPPVPGVVYCIPGVTATRCRGTFWETGKLYEKGQEGGALTPVEYTAALKRIGELRKLIASLGANAEAGEIAAVGEVAAQARAELRQVGLRVCNSLAGDERIDSERRLLRVVRVLDDLDVATLNEAPSDSAKTAPGFSQVSLLLTRTVSSLDEFTRELPLEPDPFVDS